MLGYGRRFLRLRSRERRILLRAYAWIALVDVALRAMGFRRLLRLVESWTPRKLDEITPVTIGRAYLYGGWIEKAARHHVVQAECLHRSVVLHAWLRREGLPSELEIGVRKEDGELKAHAWVRLGGHVVNDQRAAVATFTTLARGLMDDGSSDSGAIGWTEVAGLKWQ